MDLDDISNNVFEENFKETGNNDEKGKSYKEDYH